MKKIILFTAVLVCMALLLSACGSSNAGSSDAAVTYMTVEADSNGDLVIDTSGATERATYVNYKAGDAIIQLLFVRDSEGTLHYAFNTCQTCNPSPKAYFVQNGDKFTCQNCGNSFSVNEVGASKGGCNPANIASVTETGDTLVIPAEYLEQYSGNFAYWQGLTGA